jgi:GNAT superfamily N-acetyltransferase
VSQHPVVVRAATAEDAADVAAVHVAGWRWAYAGLLGDDVLAALDVEARRAMWERAATAGRTVLLVAERDGLLVGFVAGGRSRDADADEGTGEVAAFYIRHDVQGTGVGAALMNAALAALTERGCTEATLWVLERNALGRSFYERGGWRPDGTVREEREGGGDPVVELRYRRPLN